MRIITFHTNEEILIRKAISGDQRAQKELYERHSPKMLSVCRQYVRDLQFAEDAMIRGFVKVFKKLHTYRHEGSFEGWIRRIMIREAIGFLRKKQFVVFDDEVLDADPPAEYETDANLEVTYIQKLIDALPEGYKMVFVLHVVEGYKHSEIAGLLQISEGTSRSQLYKARGLLQSQLRQQKRHGYGTH